MSFYDDDYDDIECADGCDICALRRDAFRARRNRTLRTLGIILGVVVAVMVVLVLLACGGGIQPASEGDRPLQTGRQPAPAATNAVEGR